MTPARPFSRTLLVQARRDALSRLAAAFGVARDDIRWSEGAGDPGYLTARTPAMTVLPVAGDFSWYVEPELWGAEAEAFGETLRALSAPDLAIALPDETSGSPFAYLLYLDGTKRPVDIEEDAVTGETVVIGDTALRTRLRAIPEGPAGA